MVAVYPLPWGERLVVRDQDVSLGVCPECESVELGLSDLDSGVCSACHCLALFREASSWL